MSLLLAVFALTSAIGQDQDTAWLGPAGNPQVEEIMRTRPGRGAMADGSAPTQAEEAVKQFRVREGFEIELVASEPVIGQPLYINFDRRGRMWVVQYLQYQFPAGLKVVRYDNHLRAQFDKVPEPPPNHFPGADKITVFEDTDGDGIYDAHKDVITGLSITSSVAIGGGGIWVLQPPYLLFYPDLDGDDVPDGDPEVHLRGFGLEDTHSVANSLDFGPDGWLYAANGSTTTGNVSSAVTKNVRWEGQNIWRYHPKTQVFEIYAEGGGNTFSMDIDSVGRVFSGTNNGKTRGMYYPQGSYGKKGWGKHGPLTNPYAFGFFQHMGHQGDDRRFAQAFTIYEGGLFPEEFDGKIIAPNALHNVVWVSDRIRDTSTYRTVDEENLVTSDDRWFRPVCAKVGPDGAVYIADWYDSRLSHVSPVDDWHKESGRIYRVKPEGAALSAPPNVGAMTDEDLVTLFDHSNEWVRRQAVLALGERADAKVLPKLEEIARGNHGQRSLESFWALNLCGGFTDKIAAEFLGHPDAHIRRWTVRLLGDRRYAGEVLGGMLAQLAATESEVQVRSQLASTAKRLPAREGLPIVKALLARSEDVDDLHMPLLDWWVIEDKAESDRELVMKLFAEPGLWKLPMTRETVLSRIMRRYAMAGGRQNYETCARLLGMAPDDSAKKALMTGLVEAFQGMTIPDLPESLTKALDDYQGEIAGGGLALGVRRGDGTALKEALKVVKNDDSDPVERLALVKLFGEIDKPEVVEPLIDLLKLDGQSALKRVAMQSLAHYDDDAIPKGILGRYGSSLPSEHNVRSTANRVLASREDWALALLTTVDEWRIKASDISPDVVQQMRLHGNAEIDALVQKHWPDLSGESAEAKIREIVRLRQLLASESDAKVDAEKGEALFTARCAICHTLFGKGGKAGPDLTGYERGNVDFWLHATIDPSLEIREGFGNYIAVMKDGRTLTGMIEAQDPRTVTLRDVANQTTVLNREKMQKLEATPISLMPEGLLAGLTEAQLRDLFAYLMREK